MTSASLCAVSANFGIDVVGNLPKNLETGIYYGWASVDNDKVHKMVMSIGWNPFYENEHKSMVRFVGRFNHICGRVADDVTSGSALEIVLSVNCAKQNDKLTIVSHDEA